MISIKSDKEIARMREACAVVRDTLLFIGKELHAGMTTQQVDDLVYKYITSCGAIPTCKGYGGFPGSACVSVNEVVVHGIPGSRVIMDGDIVSVDITAGKNGYIGDACRTFCIGNVSEEARKLVKVTEECFFTGLQGVGPGTPLFDISAAVQQHAESNGFGVVRSYVGHGIGRDMHEDPSVPNYGKRGTGVRLKPGMTICVEPMITMGSWRTVTDREDGWTARTADGSWAAHYENTVLITPDGYEILTL